MTRMPETHCRSPVHRDWNPLRILIPHRDTRPTPTVNTRPRADSDDPTSTPAHSRWHHVASPLWALRPPDITTTTHRRSPYYGAAGKPKLHRQPGVSGTDGQALAPLRRSAWPTTLHVHCRRSSSARPILHSHIHCRRSSSARPMDHGSPWYPTHSTASKSLRGLPHGHHRAECRVTCGPGRRQTSWHARGPPFCLHASTARAGRRDNQSPPTAPQ